MSKDIANSTNQKSAAKPFTRRGVTILPPAVPPKASFSRIQKAVKAAARKHAELVAG